MAADAPDVADSTPETNEVSPSPRPMMNSRAPLIEALSRSIPLVEERKLTMLSATPEMSIAISCRPPDTAEMTGGSFAKTGVSSWTNASEMSALSCLNGPDSPFAAFLIPSIPSATVPPATPSATTAGSAPANACPATPPATANADPISAEVRVIFVTVAL